MIRGGHSGQAPSRLAALLVLLGLAASCEGSCRRTAREAAELAVAGSTRELRERRSGTPAHSATGRPLLVILLDGVGRDLLYDLVRSGKMPRLSELLGQDGRGSFPHAHFEERYLATLPSTTIASWTTAFTGAPPAVHGVSGNEFFIRETETMVAPAPVSIDNPGLAMANYTDHYLDRFIPVPTVYEQLRAREPHILIWVAMQQLQKGADTLILTSRLAYAEAFKAFLAERFEEARENQPSRERPDVQRVYATLDEEVIEETAETLAERDTPPDVLTVYLPGPDLYAHVAASGPDEARRLYLAEVIDPAIGRLYAALAKKGALTGRFVVVTSDHGHTEVLHDDRHALGIGEGEPPAVLRLAGFRPRPFEARVDPGTVFDAVLAYQGAMAFVYLADRSTCSGGGRPCAWRDPPRYEQDVLAAADAFHRNDRDGHLVAALRGTLDLVLARRPVPVDEVDRAFEVYVGGGRLVPIERYLADHPRPHYVELAARLRDLGRGPRGERAGDVVLIAHNGDRDEPAGRYYFAGQYHSWHGSPSRRDSELPLVVAHPGRSAAELGRLTGEALSETRLQQALTPLLLRLRSAGEPPAAR